MSTRPSVRRLAVGCGVFALIFLAAVGSRAFFAHKAGPDLHWTAFEATFTLTSIANGHVVYGRFWRRSDGSTRRETGPSLEDVRVIDIKNVQMNRWFLYTDAKWKSFPMDTSAFRPPLMRVSRLTLLPTERAGLQVYAMSPQDGYRYEVAPVLNFFPLLREMPRAREAYSDVLLHDPEDSLFLPAQGEVVEYRSEVRGIWSTETAPAIQPATGTRRGATPCLVGAVRK